MAKGLENPGSSIPGISNDPGGLEILIADAIALLVAMVVVRFSFIFPTLPLQERARRYPH